jgi:hypothetical protein
MQKPITMKTLLILHLIWLLIFPNPIVGCICDSIASFADGIDKESSILQIQILKHGSLPVTEIREFMHNQLYENQRFNNKLNSLPPLPPYNYLSYSLIKVIEIISGNPIADTIVFFNGTGSMCLGSLSQYEVGKSYILKVSESSKQEIKPELIKYIQERGLLSHDWTDKNIYTNGICYEWLLTLEDKIVKGFIKHNKRAQLMRELNQNYGNLSDDEMQKLKTMVQATKSEEMDYSDFVSLIRERINRIRSTTE